MENTLAYYDTAIITPVKSFIVQTPKLCEQLEFCLIPVCLSICGETYR
jgi:hypothetical protein